MGEKDSADDRISDPLFDKLEYGKCQNGNNYEEWNNFKKD